MNTFHQSSLSNQGTPHMSGACGFCSGRKDELDTKKLAGQLFGGCQKVSSQGRLENPHVAHTKDCLEFIKFYGKEIKDYKVSFQPPGKSLFYPNVTPFWLACRAGHLKTCKKLYQEPSMLTEAPECVNGANGRTPLMVAVESGQVNIVEALLKWGADTETKDADGFGVDALNCYFNTDSMIQKEISSCLKKYREEKGIPQYDSRKDPMVTENPLEAVVKVKQYHID